MPFKLQSVYTIHTYVRTCVIQTGAFFGYNITHSNLFDYEDDDLRHKSLAEMKKMVSLYNYAATYFTLHVCTYLIGGCF